MSVKDNSFPLIGDLSLQLAGADGLLNCYVNLDMGAGQVPVSNGVFEVAFRRAYLRVITSGFEIEKKSRFGIFSAPQQTTKKIVKTTVDQRSKKLGYDFSIPLKATPATLEAAVEAKANVDSTHNRIATSEEVEEGELTYQLVKARGGDTWEIGDGESSTPLDGTILNSIKLFSAKPVLGGNRQAIEVQLIVQQVDMLLEHHSSEGVTWAINSFGALNRRKVAKIFAAKCLAKRYSLDAPYHGKFAISYLVEEVSDDTFS